MKTFAFLTLLAALILAACAGASGSGSEPGQSGKKIQVDNGEYTDISASELETMLKNKDFVFVNVHVPFEGNIPNTDLSIPFDTIDQHLDQLPADKNAKIVLYCRSDRMSNIAAETLVKKGYTNVYNLDGGFNNWESAGLPLEK
jgi:phage shock protein E